MPGMSVFQALTAVIFDEKYSGIQRFYEKNEKNRKNNQK